MRCKSVINFMIYTVSQIIINYKYILINPNDKYILVKATIATFV